MITAFVQQYQAILALVLLGLLLLAFLLERYPASVTALAGAGACLLLGLVETRDALAVFSNTAPITIAAMLILTGALVRTGALENLAQWFIQRGRRQPKAALASFYIAAAGSSAFLNNTPVVAVLLPIAQRLARALRIPPTQLLIPLSYAAILGGTCTLIGTSTNLLVDGVARSAGLQPFGIFEITGIGLLTATVGLAATALMAPRLLPDRGPISGRAEDVAGAVFLTDLEVAAGASIIGERVGDVRAFQHGDIVIVSIASGGTLKRHDLGNHVIKAGDRISIMANLAETLTLKASPDFGNAEIRRRSNAPDLPVVVEAILAPPDAGARWYYPSDLDLERHGVKLLAVSRHGEQPGISLATIRLKPADLLLIEGTPDSLALLAEHTALVNLSRPRAQSYRRDKAPIAVLAMLSVVGLAAFGVMAIEALAFLAVAAILLLRCIDADEAWQSVDANLLLLIVGMLVVGTALEKSGAVRLIVDAFKPLLGGSTPFMVLLSVYCVTVLLTEIVTNHAVAVIMTPLAIGLADSLGLDARPLVVAVMFGASACFATPIGFQTNAMVYGAGNYRFADFLRIGVPLNLIVGLATCIGIWLLMPLSR